jgi:hypothetical protein
MIPSVLRNLGARAGIGALGTIYFALGWMSARLALQGARHPDAGLPGALRVLLDRPRGPWILGGIVLGLACLSGVRLAEAFGGRRAWWARIGSALNGFGYAVLAWSATRMLLHIQGGDEAVEKEGVAWLVSRPWGATALEAVGAGIAAGGLFEGYQGLRGRLTYSAGRLPRGLAGPFRFVARFGLLARGTVILAVGWFVIRAAEELDPAGVRTIGGALTAFSRTALGPLLLGVVSAGLAAYGVHLWMLMLLKRRV